MRPKQGLSPRVRGNLVHIALDSTLVGSIPARAGEPHSGESLRMPSLDRVYPRACGGTVCPIIALDFTPSRVYPRACGGTESPLRP